VFTSERGSPFTTAGFARMVERVGVAARLDFKAHPHMLRHACGFALANKGHDTRALQPVSWNPSSSYFPAQNSTGFGWRQNRPGCGKLQGQTKLH
jgi:hypothetical protein